MELNQQHKCAGCNGRNALLQPATRIYMPIMQYKTGRIAQKQVMRGLSAKAKKQ